MAARWRLNRHSHLHWRRLDDDWVVFDAGSGDTHQLDAISAAALMCLEAEALDLPRLIEVLKSELDLPADGSLSTKLEHLLDQLSSFQLIEPVET